MTAPLSDVCFCPGCAATLGLSTGDCPICGWRHDDYLIPSVGMLFKAVSGVTFDGVSVDYLRRLVHAARGEFVPMQHPEPSADELAAALSTPSQENPNED